MTQHCCLHNKVYVLHKSVEYCLGNVMLSSKIKTIFHTHTAFVIEFFRISRVIFNEEKETKKFL